MAVHTGSWWGLPDLGITELIGKLLGSKTTSQGGSDIIPNAKVYSPSPATPNTNTMTSQATLGSVGTGGNTSTDNNPSTTINGNPVDSNNFSVPSGPSEADIAAIYEPILQSLNTQEATTTQSKADQQAILDQMIAEGTLQLGNSQQLENANLETQKTAVGTEKQSALQQALTAYQALTQRNRSLHGQGSSVGGAIADITGEAYLKNLSGIQSSESASMDKIRTASATIDSFYVEQESKQRADAASKKLEIETNFSNAINQINSLRGQTLSAKQQMIVDVKTDIQNKLADLQNSIASNQLSLNTWRQEQQDALTMQVKALADSRYTTDPNTFANNNDTASLLNQQTGVPTTQASTPNYTSYYYGQPKTKDELATLNPFLS
jgi:hypothetical protein